MSSTDLIERSFQMPILPKQSHAILDTDQELKEIIETARYLDNPVIKKALDFEFQFRNKQEKELIYFLKKIKTKLVKKLEEISKDKRDSHDTLQQILLERLSTDEKNIEGLNKALESYSADKGEVTYAVKTNKMVGVLQGAIKFVQEKIQVFLESLKVEGFKLPGYFNGITQPNDIPILGKTPEGTSARTFYIATVLNTYLVTEETSLADVPSFNSQENGPWIDRSSIAHLNPLPNHLEVKGFKSCTYYFSDEKTPKGLITLHNKYAFGGHRNEERYKGNKDYGPEDCSSIIGKLTYKNDSLSTLDFLKRHQDYFSVNSLTEKKEQPFASDTLTSSTELPCTLGGDIVKNYQPIAIHNPKEIKPGQVYCHRTYNISQDPKKTGEGIGGHMALVLGTRLNGNIVTIACCRDMPDMEGIGIEEFPFNDPDNRKMMLFNVRV